MFSQVGRSRPLVLNASLQSFLDGLLGLKRSPVRIFANPAADELARHYRADAVSVGESVFIREPLYPRAEPPISHCSATS